MCGIATKPLGAFYDKGSTYSLFFFLKGGAHNHKNASLVSKNDVVVYLGHVIIHRDAVRFLLKPVFG